MFKQMCIDKIEKIAMKQLVESRKKVSDIEVKLYDIGYSVYSTNALFEERIGDIKANIDALKNSQESLKELARVDNKNLEDDINQHIQELGFMVKELSALKTHSPRNAVDEENIYKSLTHDLKNIFKHVQIEEIQAFLEQEDLKRWFENICKCVVIDPETGAFGETYNYILDGLIGYIEEKGMTLIMPKINHF